MHHETRPRERAETAAREYWRRMHAGQSGSKVLSEIAAAHQVSDQAVRLAIGRMVLHNLGASRTDDLAVGL